MKNSVNTKTYVAGMIVSYDDIIRYYLSKTLGEVMVIRLPDGKGGIVSTYDHSLIETPTYDAEKLAGHIGLYSDGTTDEEDMFYAEGVLKNW